MQRLAKLCGLLSSDHDGERATAARMATQLLKSHDTTWHDLVMRAMLPTGRHRSRTGQPSRKPRKNGARHPCQVLGPANEWERDFLTSVIDRNRWPLSPKQRGILDKLRNRLCCRSRLMRISHPRITTAAQAF